MPLSLSVGRIFAVSMVAVGLMAGGCANQQKALESGVAGAPSPGSQQEFQVTVGDRVFFDTDSSDLSAPAQATLNRQIQWLTQYPQYNFTIEGHADERGTREYNLALGARRATGVRDFMIAHGIAASRIHTISYGKERPVAVCDDISCWSQNRRAVTVLDSAN
jgi:peptidoglycan-associated lipoprotein